MIRVVLVIAASLIALSGCGGGDSHAKGAAATSTAATTVSEQNYADQIVKAFRATYSSKAEGADAASAADWSAFVATIKAINPPERLRLAHNRMVAGFQAYANDLKNAADVCDKTPGPGGPCFTAAHEANDQWQAALHRAYEIPGLSWDTLLG